VINVILSSLGTWCLSRRASWLLSVRADSPSRDFYSDEAKWEGFLDRLELESLATFRLPWLGSWSLIL